MFVVVVVVVVVVVIIIIIISVYMYSGRPLIQTFLQPEGRYHCF